MIKKDDIQRILDAVQIVDVVSAFVPLKKRGVNYIGCCPFHNEKTPSFTVSPTKGIFKCFGCGEAGNAVHFLMKHEHYSYPEALRFLANKYGIEIEEKELTPEEKTLQDEKEALLNLNAAAKKYFAQVLQDDQEGKKIGLSYFKEREISDESIKKWGLGYCKNSWAEFTSWAKKEGYPIELLVKSGLSIEKEEEHLQYDRFRASVIFPIYTLGGRVLGFTGRVLEQNAKKAKYVNSPESEIFSKRKVLFGINLAKNAIAKEDLCYLVEGNIDAIMLSQNGVENVVASSGTALTTEQIHIIKRYTKNVTVLYDGDAAGIHAAFRAIDMFLENELNVKIVLFPDGEDPDSYCRKLPQEEFHTFLKEKAQNFIIFKTNLLLDEAKDDPFKRSELIKEIINTISLIPDTIERQAYVQQCSTILKMKEEVLNAELQKFLRQRYFKQKGVQPSEIKEIEQVITPWVAKEQILEEQNPCQEQEKKIMSLLLNYGERQTKQITLSESGEAEEKTFVVAAYIVGEIINDEIEFDNPLYAKIFGVFRDFILDQSTLPPISIFTNNPEEEVQNLCTTLLINKYSISGSWQKKFDVYVPALDDDDKINQEVKETIFSLKLNKLEMKLSALKEKLKSAKDEENIMMLLAQQKKLETIKKLLSEKLGRVILK